MALWHCQDDLCRSAHPARSERSLRVARHRTENHLELFSNAANRSGRGNRMSMRLSPAADWTPRGWLSTAALVCVASSFVCFTTARVAAQEGAAESDARKKQREENLAAMHRRASAM